ncbi:MAG: IS21 family transposase [Proteobacteria bacterium]|nr:IS21 family transposase [Pseudomonadota bacterium]
MANRNFEVYHYKQILYRLKSGQSQREIERCKLASRSKVRQIIEIATKQGWLDEGTAMPSDNEIAKHFIKTQPKQNQSYALPFKKEIVKWVNEGIQANVIHQHLQDNYNFDGSYNSIQRFVKKLKTQNQINLTVPLVFQPGEAAQVDFGQGPLLYDERVGKDVKTWFFVMTLCYSRHQYVELVTHQDVDTWLNCHKNAFEWFGGIPKKIIIDNPKCAITKASTTDPQVQRSYESLAYDYGFVISPCPPADPQKKGRVESGVKYVKNNFTPLRVFSSLQQANKELKAWVLTTAGKRVHGTTKQQPLTRFESIEKASLKALPNHCVELVTWRKAKLHRDCHIKVNQCRYSAPFKYATLQLWVAITQTTVRIYYQHELVATHARSFEPDTPRTQLDHLPQGAKIFFEQDAPWCLAQAKLIGDNCVRVIEQLINNPVKDLLRAAQSVIRLTQKYHNTRVDNACLRAIHFNSIDLQTIKMILKQSLDHDTLDVEQTLKPLSNAYQGNGVYQRQSSKLKNQGTSHG